MLYPNNCEERVGFTEIRQLLLKHCLSPMGQEMVGKMQVMNRFDQIDRFLKQTNEFKSIIENQEPLQINVFFDVKKLAEKIRIEGSFLAEEEVFQLYISLQTVFSVLRFFSERKEVFPALEALFENLPVENSIVKDIERVIDPKGKIKPNASLRLQSISTEISKSEQEVRRRMDSIYKMAVGKSWVADGSLTVRDGRMCIPILAEHKRKLKGFIHDESASGQTVYLEPEEIFNINNQLRDLEFERRREIIQILTTLTDAIRPHNPLLLNYHGFLTKLDFVRAKALFALEIGASLPLLSKDAVIKLENARHPLLMLSFKKEHRTVVPLNAHIDGNLRILVVSGPNAGGKSVCMKTIGLLQIMAQSGLLIPADGHTQVGVFDQIFADIGDDQSIESDLSTYSAHLNKMRHFVAHATPKTLVLMDEFGTGTDPQFGGPIAEAVLETLNKKKVRGVVTTHYSNIKLFAGNHEGLENASMLFDNAKMKPLYVLDIGKPGSSYAFEIAQNIGLQKEVIELAKNKIGFKQNNLDKMLVELEKEKKAIHQAKINLSNQQNKVKNLVAENEKQKDFLEENRKQLLKDAKLEAQNIIKNANKLVENTISQIKKKQADKEVTRALRSNLNKELQAHHVKEEKKVVTVVPVDDEIVAGDWVQLMSNDAVGQVVTVNKNNMVVALGDLRTVVKRNAVKKVSHKQVKKIASSSYSGGMTDLATNFKAELDLRGMRSEAALAEVEKYLDRAVMLGFPSIKIVHGKGDGILRKMIREYLKKYSQVNRVEDEHADRGGDGITYVYLN